jgi:hypothetical protein
VGARVELPHGAGAPSPELVRTLCARAGLRLPDTDVAAVTAALAAHADALEQLRGLEVPAQEPAFDVAWE